MLHFFSFSVIHKQLSLLFQFIRLVQGQNTCASATAETWVRLPVVIPDWLVVAPECWIVKSKGACYTLPVKVAGGNRHGRWHNEEEADACVCLPRTTAITSEIVLFKIGEEKGERITNKGAGVVCVSIRNETIDCGRGRNGERETREGGIHWRRLDLWLASQQEVPEIN